MSAGTRAMPTRATEIGKWIAGLLSDNAAVTTLVGTRIFPYTTREPVPCPWIVFDNISIEYEDTKDAGDESAVRMSILACAETYDGSVSLVNKVIDAIQDQVCSSLGGAHLAIDNVAGTHEPEQGYIQEVNINIQL